MFTGIIECVAVIKHCKTTQQGTVFTIEYNNSAEVVRGESIAVNGVCLTVTEHTSTHYSCFASPHTIATTTLGVLRNGDAVHLERAVRPMDRMGGHFVTGHVDTALPLRSVLTEGTILVVSIDIPEQYLACVIPQGSIALDGVSLTISSMQRTILSVTIIPETQHATTITHWNAGKHINVEFDMLGKYVAQALAVGKQPCITEEFLQQNGFI